MFSFLGKIVARGWPLFLIAWGALLAGVWLTAPAWNSVAEDRDFGMLPDSMPSRRAEAIFKKAFPFDVTASNIVVLLCREDRELGDADKAFVEETVKPAILRSAEEEGGLNNDPLSSGKSIIAALHTYKEPGAGALLISPDRKATLVVLDLVTEYTEHRNWATVGKIEEKVAELKEKAPAGLELYLSGSATVGRDVTKAQAESGSSTEFWTVVLVVLLLLLIYRAPLLAVVPLLGVFIVVQVGLKVLTHLAAAGVLNVFDGLQIFIIVVVYGSGVDYSLFLIARYREELEKSGSVRAAVADALGKVGAALTASAGTVAAAIAMMAFADFGKFHEAGITIAFCLLISLCGVLTLTPALLCLLGRFAFWPKMPHVRVDNSSDGADKAVNSSEPLRREHSLIPWRKLGQALVRRPGVIWLGSVALMLPFVVVALLHAGNTNYDPLELLPPTAPGVVGTRKMQGHFPAGTTGPVTVLLHNPQIDFRQAKNQALVDKLIERIRSRRAELELADLRSLTDPFGITPAARELNRGPVPLPPTPDVLKLSSPGSVFTPGWGGWIFADPDFGGGSRSEAIMRELILQHYVSFAVDGQVTRFVLVSTRNPLSRAAAQSLTTIEEAIDAELPAELKGTEVHVLGATASIRDLITVVSHDQTKIQVLVCVSVLLILIVLLRQPIVSLYLIASVLFSYFATLGATYAFFWALDPAGFHGLDWKVPVLLFTILVAVGEDYNIFLMTRVHEEQRARGAVEGITHALAQTGRIITSCGIIMAGAFCSLLPASLVDLRQLGFALALGVLLDTFLVRPILVPAFLILRERLAKRG